jgi:hypothetical protein
MSMVTPRAWRITVAVCCLAAVAEVALTVASSQGGTRSRAEGDRRADGTQPTESCWRLTGRGMRATVL